MSKRYDRTEALGREKHTEGLGDSKIGSWSSSVGTTHKKVKTRSTGAVGDTDCTSELNEISSRDIVVFQERRQSVDRVVDTVVGG